jgi:hypothetical protein
MLAGHKKRTKHRLYNPQLTAEISLGEVSGGWSATRKLESGAAQCRSQNRGPFKSLQRIWRECRKNLADNGSQLM